MSGLPKATIDLNPSKKGKKTKAVVEAQKNVNVNLTTSDDHMEMVEKARNTAASHHDPFTTEEPLTHQTTRTEPPKEVIFEGATKTSNHNSVSGPYTKDKKPAKDSTKEAFRSESLAHCMGINPSNKGGKVNPSDQSPVSHDEDVEMVARGETLAPHHHSSSSSTRTTSETPKVSAPITKVKKPAKASTKEKVPDFVQEYADSLEFTVKHKRAIVKRSKQSPVSHDEDVEMVVGTRNKVPNHQSSSSSTGTSASETPKIAKIVIPSAEVNVKGATKPPNSTSLCDASMKLEEETHYQMSNYRSRKNTVPTNPGLEKGCHDQQSSSSSEEKETDDDKDNDSEEDDQQSSSSSEEKKTDDDKDNDSEENDANESSSSDEPQAKRTPNYSLPDWWLKEILQYTFHYNNKYDTITPLYNFLFPNEKEKHKGQLERHAQYLQFTKKGAYTLKPTPAGFFENDKQIEFVKNIAAQHDLKYEEPDQSNNNSQNQQNEENEGGDSEVTNTGKPSGKAKTAKKRSGSPLQSTKSPKKKRVINNESATSSAKVFECSFCEYSFSGQSALHGHLMQHHYEHLLCCQRCSYTTNKLGSLKSHLVLAESLTDEAAEKEAKCSWTCLECDFHAEERDAILGHMISEHQHVDEKEYPDLLDFDLTETATLERFPHHLFFKWGACYSLMYHKFIGHHNNNGYIMIDANNKGYHSLHPLILEAFVGPKPGKDYECHHKDHIRDNNDVDNLMWMQKEEHSRERWILTNTSRDFYDENKDNEYKFLRHMKIIANNNGLNYNNIKVCLDEEKQDIQTKHKEMHTNFTELMKKLLDFQTELAGVQQKHKELSLAPPVVLDLTGFTLPEGSDPSDFLMEFAKPHPEYPDYIFFATGYCFSKKTRTGNKRNEKPHGFIGSPRNGYIKFHLSTNGSRVDTSMHVEMLKLFGPEKPNEIQKWDGDHIDNTRHNIWWNLQWLLHGDNSLKQRELENSWLAFMDKYKDIAAVGDSLYKKAKLNKAQTKEIKDLEKKYDGVQNEMRDLEHRMDVLTTRLNVWEKELQNLFEKKRNEEKINDIYGKIKFNCKQLEKHISTELKNDIQKVQLNF